MKDNVQEIFIDLIDGPANAMRTELDRNALFELADNIKQNGLINPITVRPKKSLDVGASGAASERSSDDASDDRQRFEVVAGHRRLSACKIAGKIKIQCIVRELTDDQTFAVMAAENLERADVDPVDEAVFITEFIDRTKKTVPEVAKALRRSVGFVETRLLVGAMPDYMQAHLKSGGLKLGAALALLQITDDETRQMWVEMAVRDGVSVAQAEYWLHSWKMQTLPGGERSDTPPGDFVPGAPYQAMFRCAIDGKERDVRLFKTILIYEENLPIFEAFVSAFNESTGKINLDAEGNI